MRLTLRTVFILLYFLAVILLWKNVYLILVSSLLSYAFLIVEFLIERQNLRAGKYIAVVKKNHNRFFIIFLFTFGFLLVLLGLSDKFDSNSFKGLNSKVFGGVFLILSALIPDKNRLFLLTDNAVKFEGDLWMQEVWKYKKLDKVVIGPEEIKFVKGSESETFLIEKEDRELIKNIRALLSPKLEDRLSVNESRFTTGG